jgi:hypothetical protein
LSTLCTSSRQKRPRREGGSRSFVGWWGRSLTVDLSLWFLDTHAPSRFCPLARLVVPPTSTPSHFAVISRPARPPNDDEPPPKSTLNDVCGRPPSLIALGNRRGVIWNLPEERRSSGAPATLWTDSDGAQQQKASTNNGRTRRSSALLCHLCNRRAACVCLPHHNQQRERERERERPFAVASVCRCWSLPCRRDRPRAARILTAS